MKKIIGIFIFLIVIAGGVGFGINAANGITGHTSQKEVLPAKETSHQNEVVKEASPEETTPGIPQKITIPSINVDTDVESVGVKGPKRQMETPENADNGGWYSLGAKPGGKGSAVIAGHLDKADGSPAAFWDISKLKEGAKIIITDENGHDFTFAVTKVTEYPYDDFPIAEVFAPSGPSMLNLISCKGDWNSETKNYSHRTVVYSQLVE